VLDLTPKVHFWGSLRQPGLENGFDKPVLGFLKKVTKSQKVQNLGYFFAGPKQGGAYICSISGLHYYNKYKCTMDQGL